MVTQVGGSVDGYAMLCALCNNNDDNDDGPIADLSNLSDNDVVDFW
jgi:hypothetical protein